MARAAQTEGLSDVQKAEAASKAALSAFLKSPLPANYNACILANRAYQTAFVAQYAPTPAPEEKKS